jgi:hypothetical protein
MTQVKEMFIPRPTPQTMNFLDGKDLLSQRSPKGNLLTVQLGDDRKDSEVGDLTTENSRCAKPSLDVILQNHRMIRCPRIPSAKSIQNRFVFKPEQRRNQGNTFTAYSVHRKLLRDQRVGSNIEKHAGDETPELTDPTLTSNSKTEFSELLDHVISQEVIDWDMNTPYSKDVRLIREHTPGGFTNRADIILRRREFPQSTERRQSGASGTQQQLFTPTNSQNPQLEHLGRFGVYSVMSSNLRSASLQANGGCTPATIKASSGSRFRYNTRDVTELPLQTPVHSKPGSSWTPGTKTNKSSNWKLDTIPDLDKLLSSQPAFTRYVKYQTSRISET